MRRLKMYDGERQITPKIDDIWADFVASEIYGITLWKFYFKMIICFVTPRLRATKINK